MVHVEDEILVEGLKQGLQEAHEQLYDQYSEMLVRFTLSAFKVGIEEAEDITIETLHKSILKIDTFDFSEGKPNGFRNWLFQIAKNIFYDRQKLEFELYSLEEETFEVPTTNREETVTETIQAVRDALDTLPKNQSKTLKFYFNGWSLIEIAHYLEADPATVRKWKERGLKTITVILEKHPAIQHMLDYNKKRIGELK